MTRVLETVLTGRNLLSPMLATASRDVVAFNAQMSGANIKAATTATTSAQVQDRAADKIAASNVKASVSAQTSATTQSRAHAQAAESATLQSRVQQSANNALARSNSLLGTSLTPLTAGLGAVSLGLAYAGYRGMEFGTAMSQVQAATQASERDMDRLGDAAIEWGAKTQYSSVEAAQGITEMAKAGVSTADILGGGLAGALNLAAAGQMEVAEAAETGATALSVFGLKGDQMSHVADLLAAGAGKAQGSVHDLSAALNQSALVANQTGLSIEDTAGALAMFASNGLVGSDAGTSFKTMLQALTPNSLAASQAMDEIGFSAYDAQGHFVGMESVAAQLRTGLAGLTEEQRNTTLETIFGSDAVRAASVLYKEGAAGVAEWTGKVDDAGYAQRQAAQLTDNLRGDLERLSGAFDSAMTTIGSGAQGPLRAVVQALTFLVDIGGDVLGFWSDLPGPVQVAVGAFLAFTALRGPLDALWGRIAVGITYTVTGMGMAAGATTGLGTAAGAARGAIGGLVAAAAPLAGLMILSSAISSVMAFSRAGDEARESISAFDDSLRDMGNGARADAVADQIDNARDSIREYQATIEAYDSQGWFNKNFWYVPFGGEKTEVEDARQSLEAYERQLSRLERTNTRASETTDVLAERFRLSKSEVQDLADKYEIDLGGSIAQTRIRFGQLYTQEYGTTPIDAANALGTAATSAKEQVEEATKAQEDWLKSLQDIAAGFVDPLVAYSGLLDEKKAAERESAEATAAATDDSSDSWEDYVDDVDVSMDELATRLQEQITNQENWRTNIGQIAAWAGADVAQYLANMGQDGVEIVAAMADGSIAENQRMADTIREDIRVGGAGWAAAMDTEMKNVQAIAAAGGQKTAAGLAYELGLGVQQVADIAARYGIVLANGIDPLLQALGQRTVAIQQRGSQPNSGSLDRPGFSDGGYTGPGGKYTPAGIVHAGEIVWSQDDISAHGGPDRVEQMRRARHGYADGGFVTADDVPRPPSTAPYGVPISTAADATMQKGFDEVRAWLTANTEATGGGPAGTGGIGGDWTAIFNFVKARIPQARVNSAYRPGDPGYHGRGKAVDFGFGAGPGGNGSAGLASINRLIHDSIGANLAELIYDGLGDDRPDLYMGKPHTYSAGTRAEHHNHVHAAARANGGEVGPGRLFRVGENGPEYARFNSPGVVYPTAPAAMPGYGAATAGTGSNGGGGPVQVHVDARVFVGDREITDIARVEAIAVVVEAEGLRQQRGRYNG